VYGLCIYMINIHTSISLSHQSSIIFVIFIPKWKSGEQVNSSLIVCTIQFSDAHSLIFPSQIKQWFLGPLSKAVQLKGPHPYDAKLLGTIWFKNSGRCNVGSSPNITNLRIDWVLQYFLRIPRSQHRMRLWHGLQLDTAQWHRPLWYVRSKKAPGKTPLWPSRGRCNAIVEGNPATLKEVAAGSFR